jgi:hypothetical protein
MSLSFLSFLLCTWQSRNANRHANDQLSYPVGLPLLPLMLAGWLCRTETRILPAKSLSPAPLRECR